MPIKIAQVTATGTLATEGGKLLSAVFRDTGSAGTAVFRDGGPGGAEKGTYNSPAGAAADQFPIPGGGILFTTDFHVTLTNVDGCSIVYDNMKGD